MTGEKAFVQGNPHIRGNGDIDRIVFYSEQYYRKISGEVCIYPVGEKKNYGRRWVFPPPPDASGW